MSDLTPELAAEVVTACQANADEAASVLSRSLDGEFTMRVGEAANYQADATPDGFDGPGLALLMKFDAVGACMLLPEASGLLPDWVAHPDASGESKLSSLAQELSMLLMPETMMANDFRAAQVENLSAALSAAHVGEAAGLVPLTIGAGEQTGQLSLIWPLASPDDLLPSEAPQGGKPADAAARAPSGKSHTISDFSQLPQYTRSLLRISLPVQVVLATKKESLQNVVELAAGSIIKFDKPCDEMLELQVGDHPIALGEAVKVNDKFGFRVGQMVLPDEHFTRVRRRHTD